MTPVFAASLFAAYDDAPEVVFTRGRDADRDGRVSMIPEVGREVADLGGGRVVVAVRENGGLSLFVKARA